MRPGRIPVRAPVACSSTGRYGIARIRSAGRVGERAAVASAHAVVNVIHRTFFKHTTSSETPGFPGRVPLPRTPLPGALRAKSGHRAASMLGLALYMISFTFITNDHTKALPYLLLANR